MIIKQYLLKTSEQKYALHNEQNILIPARLVFFYDKKAGKEIPQETQKLEKKFILSEEPGINVENRGAEAKQQGESLIEHAKIEHTKDDSNKLESDEQREERIKKEFKLLNSGDVNIKESISAISTLEGKADKDKRKQAVETLKKETGIVEEGSITDQTDIALNLTVYYKAKIWAEKFKISQKVSGYMQKMYDKLSDGTLDYEKDVKPHMNRTISLASKIKKILS